MQMDRWTQPGTSTNRDSEQTHWPKGTEQVAEAERHIGGQVATGQRKSDSGRRADRSEESSGTGAERDIARPP